MYILAQEYIILANSLLFVEGQSSRRIIVECVNKAKSVLEAKMSFYLTIKACTWYIPHDLQRGTF